MSRRLALIGAGEHACVVVAAARAAGWSVLGAVGAEAHPALGCPHLGAVLEPAEALPLGSAAAWIMAIGIGVEPGFRTRLLRRWQDYDVDWATVVHPRAWVAEDVRLGAGVLVGAGAIVQSGARIGDHSIINSGVVCEHHCRVGEQSHLAPGVVLGGGCQVGGHCLIGLGAVLRDHITIADRALVAMGAVVVESVATATRVAGVPARCQGES